MRIEQNQPLQILVPVKERTIACMATIRQVSDGVLATSWPQRHRVPIPVQVERLTVTIPAAQGAYTMTCPVLKATAEGLQLAMPPREEIRHLQRRAHPRVPTELDATIEQHLGTLGNYGPVIRARTENLSEGGCLLTMGPRLPEGVFVRLHLDLPSSRRTRVFGRIVRSVLVETPEGIRYACGVQFKRVNPIVRTNLNRYILRIQYELAKRGKAIRMLSGGTT